jgi:O-antigen/teichoic acid export membrane protein
MKISHNVAWNFAGITIPLIVGVIVMPKIVSGLGVEQFGVLSVIWLMIGYFSVFDLGLGRTLTKLVADRLSVGEKQEIPSLVSTTLVIVTLSGCALGIATASFAGWIANTMLHASSAHSEDTIDAIRWLAVSLPFVLIATALFGLLEAFQSFALISAVRLPIGVLTFVAPVAVLPFSNHLDVVTAVLAGIRMITTLVLLSICYRVVPGLKGNTFAFSRNLVRPLLTYGGWLTISNVISPIMAYFDRFLIAALAGSAAIAYYTVPYDVLMRLLVFPTAIQAVLFPAFITLRSTDSLRLQGVFKKAGEVTLLLMCPALLATLLLASLGLRIWMGPQFSLHSTQVAGILIVGVFSNAMARIPFSFVQSAGHADWTAMTHMAELPVYVLSLWWLLKAYGISGAAYAWTGRVFIDTVVFYLLSAKIENSLKPQAFSSIALIAILSSCAVLLNWLVDDSTARIVLVVASVVGSAFGLVWRFKGSFAYARQPGKA